MLCFLPATPPRCLLAIPMRGRQDEADAILVDLWFGAFEATELAIPKRSSWPFEHGLFQTTGHSWGRSLS